MLSELRRTLCSADAFKLGSLESVRLRRCSSLEIYPNRRSLVSFLRRFGIALFLFVLPYPAFAQVVYTPSLGPGVYTTGGSVIKLAVSIQGSQATFSIRKIDGDPFEQRGVMTIRAGAPHGCIANCNQYQWEIFPGPNVFEVSETFDLLEYFTSGTKTFHASIGAPAVFCDGAQPEYYSGPLQISASGEGMDIVDAACTASNCDGRHLLPTGSLEYWPRGNPEPLLELNVQRTGIVTDGVTKLLLRVRSSSPVTFSLKGQDLSSPPETNPCEWGTLYRRGGTHGSCSTLTVQPELVNGQSVAFAVYKAPVHAPFGNALQQGNVIIGVTGPNIADAQFISLIKPPVILVHGLWGSAESWRGFGSYLKERGFNVCDGCIVNYRELDGGAPSFDPNNDDSKVLQLVGTTVENSLKELRRSGVAASQVDAIGHSMGGVVLRAFTKYQKSPYFTERNYGFGYFRKLFTIGTPHWGTALAQWLVTHRTDEVSWYLPGDPTLEGFMAELGQTFGDALFELQPNSDTIQSLGASLVERGHTLSSIAPDDSWTEDVLNRLPRSLTDDDESLATMDCLLGGNGQHDTIVEVESQIGGNEHSSGVNGVVHTRVSPTNVGQTESPTIRERLTFLLFPGDTDEDIYSLLPEPSVVPGVGTLIENCDETGTSDGTPLKTNSGLEHLSGVDSKYNNLTMPFTSISPEPGTVVHPGDSVNIIFSASAGDTPIEGAMVQYGDSKQVFYGTGPFSIQYTVPRESVGKIDIKAFAFGDLNEPTEAETYIVSAPPLPLSAIRALPSRLELSAVQDVFGLRVEGNNSSGAGVYYLTGSSTGTMYTTASGREDVVSVSAEGLITAKGPGYEQIRVTNGELTSTVDVEVRITNLAPKISTVTPVTMAPGDTRTVTVYSSDPDGNHIDFFLIGAPGFASLQDNDNGTATVSLNPQAPDVGSSLVSIGIIDDGSPRLGDNEVISVWVVGENTKAVAIDIKPGNATNPINPSSNGKTSVAVLSSPTFSAPSEVDRPTLTFGSTGDEQSLHYRGNGEPNCNTRDVNADGLSDLVCHFYTRLASFQSTDTRGILRGITRDGEAFEGRDSITIVGGNHDEDVDGISDEEEDAAPNDGDGNWDGILDSSQENVTSLRSVETGDFITMVSSDGCTNTSVSSVGATEFPPDPAGFVLPQGLVSFTLESCSSSNLLFFYHGESDLSGTEYRKYGPMTQSQAPTWYSLPANFSSAQFDDQRIAIASFQLVDGGLGDSDGVVNGQIVDPSGPAITGSISPIDIPTSSIWSLLAFGVVLGIVAIFFVGRKAT